MRAVVVALAMVMVVSCQNEPPMMNSSEPRVAIHSREQDRSALLEAALMANESQFDKAGELASKYSIPAIVRVAIASPGPDAANEEKAVRTAVENWNKALGGLRKVEFTTDPKNAQITVSFFPTAQDNFDSFPHPGCAGIVISTDQKGAPPSARTGNLQIATDVPGIAGKRHTLASYTFLVAKGIGAYFGLGSSKDANHIMGPDVHDSNLPAGPSKDDIAVIQGLDAFQRRVSEIAKAKKQEPIALPVIAIDKMIQDAGECWSGESVHYTFTYKNTGNAPLEVDVVPSCGCTVAKFDKVVAPGETGTLSATMNTKGFKGPIGKLVHIYSNAPGTSSSGVTIRAMVKSSFEISPSDPITIAVKSEGTTTQDVVIRPVRNPKTKVLSVDVPGMHVKAALESSSDAKGPFYVAKLTVAETAPFGRTGGVLRLKTDSADDGELMVYLTMEKGIYVVPQSIYIGSISNKDRMPVTRSISVMRSSAPFQIKSVSCANPLFKATVDTVKAGMSYRVTVAYNGGAKPGPLNDKVTILTDDPKQAKIEIPIASTVVGD